MWGSKWGDRLQMVPSNCILNHMLIPWVSKVIYYCNYLELSHYLHVFDLILCSLFVFYVLNWSANSKVPRDP